MNYMVAIQPIYTIYKHNICRFTCVSVVFVHVQGQVLQTFQLLYSCEFIQVMIRNAIWERESHYITHKELIPALRHSIILFSVFFFWPCDHLYCPLRQNVSSACFNSHQFRPFAQCFTGTSDIHMCPDCRPGLSNIIITVLLQAFSCFIEVKRSWSWSILINQCIFFNQKNSVWTTTVCFASFVCHCVHTETNTWWDQGAKCLRSFHAILDRFVSSDIIVVLKRKSIDWIWC